jgi:hypothetical protein
VSRIEPIGSDRTRETSPVARIEPVPRRHRDQDEDPRRRRRPAPRPASQAGASAVPVQGDDGRPHVDVSV